VRRHPAVSGIRLVGSRAEGRANEHSDWDFRLETSNFPAVARDLPDLLEPLAPIAQQWDRLSTHASWMLMLSGPVKIDLSFADEPHELEPPWPPTADNLPAIDRHFWDWLLWLASKNTAGKHDLVSAELQKLFEHLLEPLGVEQRPSSLRKAIDAYRIARKKAEDRFDLHVRRRLEAEVAPALGAWFNAPKTPR
jgi:hypothetical protein